MLIKNKIMIEKSIEYQFNEKELELLSIFGEDEGKVKRILSDSLIRGGLIQYLRDTNNSLCDYIQLIAKLII